MSETTADRIVKILGPLLITIAVGFATYGMTTAIGNAQDIAVLQEANRFQEKREDARDKTAEKTVMTLEKMEARMRSIENSVTKLAAMKGG